MIIVEDFSLTNMSLIESGLADLDFHSVRIDRHFSEAERQHNSDISHAMTNIEWSEHCREFSQQLADRITELMDLINENFKVYQYKEDSCSYSDNWDLFFWCNDLYFTTNGKKSGRDMSYVTLTFNSKMS